jgi:hypothetical protein
MIGHQPPENPGVDLLPHKPLGDPDPGHRFRQRRRHPAEAFLVGPQHAAEPPPEIQVQQPEANCH